MVVVLVSLCDFCWILVVVVKNIWLMSRAKEEFERSVVEEVEMFSIIVFIVYWVGLEYVVLWFDEEVL